MDWFHSETYINPNSSHVKSVQELRVVAQKYINPIDGNSLEANPVETNIDVVAQCQNKYCNLCEDYNLTKCVTCWGRFGNPQYDGLCYQKRTCNSLHTGSDFRTGCYMTSDDCFGCSVCDFGYAKQTGSNTCYDCKSIHSQCTECSGQVADETIRCDICEDGYGLQADNKTCFKCSNNHAKSCHMDGLGNHIVDLCEDGFILNSNGQCLKTCNFNEYPAIIYDQIHNTEKSVYCKACHETCRSCNYDGSDKCTSCSNGQYLSIPSSTARMGTCVNKTEAGATTLEKINIVVRNSASQTETETNLQIQMDLMSALWQAYVMANQYKGLKIEILLESGSHYILPKNMAHFNHRQTTESHIDTFNPEFHLTVRPLKCNDMLITGLETSQLISSPYCQVENTPYDEMPLELRVYIFNKVGGSFKVQIPLSLTWEGINFDALDSIQNPSSALVKMPTRDCFWIEGSLPYCPPVENSEAYHDYKTAQVCHYRSYDSIFQFKNIDRNITDETNIQRLNISNSDFSNIFYEIGSIVRLPEFNRTEEFDSNEIPWRLSMENNVFQNMSFCGSIVSNDFPTFQGTSDSYIEEYNNGIKNEIRSKFTKSPNQFITIDCSQQECFMFSFANNTVQNLNLLKTSNPETFFDKHVNWQMQKFGLVVHLTNFRGHANVIGNTISNIKLNFKDVCLYYENPSTKDGYTFDMMPLTPWISVDNFYSPNMDKETQFLIPMQHNAHQLHSLIVIDNIHKDKNVNISFNQFSDAIVTNSLISVNQKTNVFSDGITSKNLISGNITINQNSFTRSSSYVGTGVILVTKNDMQPTKSKTDADGFCGKGIEISYNNFTSIVGTCQTDTGLVRVQCNNTQLAQSMPSDYSFINMTRQIAPSEGQAGYYFNEASLETLRGSMKQYSVLVRGNRVANCSLGVQQEVREGTRTNYVERVVNHMGTLFTFQSLMRVEFTNNLIENIFPVNRLEYYVQHSPQYLNFGQTVINIQGVQLMKPLTKVDMTGSMVSALNLYELSMNNTVINRYEALQNSDALLLFAINGIKRLELADSKLALINNAQSPLLSLLGQRYTQLERDQVIGRELIISNLTLENITLSYATQTKETALLFDNFAGELNVNKFLIQGLTINEVKNNKVPSLVPKVSSIMKVVSNAIELSQLNITNVDFVSNTNQGSPIQLQLFNFTTLTTANPTIRFTNNTFKHIKYTFANKTNSKVSGLFSVFHDILQYNLDFKKNTFDNISVETSDLTPTASPSNTATILQTIKISSSQGVKVPSNMSIMIENARFDNVFVPLHASLLKHQMFMFTDPIQQMTLDQVEFSDFEHQFQPQGNKSSPQDQTIQTFDPAVGPQIIILQNSEIKTNTIHNITALKNNFTQQWKTKEEQLANGTLPPQSEPINRSVFTFNNFDQAKGIWINNLTIANIDFSDHDSSGVETMPGSGSVIRSYNSNINMNQIKATNVTSSSNASVIYVIEADHGHGSTFLAISNSRFENCMAKTGGVFYINKAASVSMYGVQFINNFANDSAVIYTSSFGNSNVQIMNINAVGNQAVRANSFGFFEDFKFDKLIISNSTFSRNKVLNGTSTLTLADSYLDLKDSQFADNTATQGTLGLKVLQDKAKDIVVKVTNSGFVSTTSSASQIPNINGTYLVVSKPNPVYDSSITLTITSCNFKSGAAKYGGAIFADGVQSLYLSIQDTLFEANRAEVHGGAVFIDNLDSYGISIKTSTFKENKCRSYGDNIYIQQTKRELNTIASGSPDLSSYQRRRLQASTGAIRALRIYSTSFTTSNSYNQIYLSNLESVLVNGLSFNKMIDSWAIEGGSMYLSNVYNLTIFGSSFIGQKSLLRGGALFMKQLNETYFGESLKYSRYVIDQNTFDNCISQQGGALAVHMVSNLKVNGTNIFKDNEVIRYKSEFIVESPLYQSQTKQYERVALPASMGRGPLMFFDCHANVRNCTVQLEEGTQISGSKIYNIENKTYFFDSGDQFSDIKPIFYTEVPPLVPQSWQPLIEEQFQLIHFGSNAVIITNTTEVDYYDSIAQQKIAQEENLRYTVNNYTQVTNYTEFNQVYNLSDIKSGNSTIFGGRVYIINDKNEIQTYDNTSIMSISIRNNTKSVIKPKLSLVENGVKLENDRFRIKAKKTGYFDVPPITVYGLPGTDLQLDIEFFFNQSEVSTVYKNSSFEFVPTNCNEGQIVNIQGICQTCSGPDLYLMEEPSKIVNGVIEIQECSVCEKNIFSCFGGNNIKSNEGYQLLNPGTATFVQCEIHNGKNVCLANNTCARGYQGIICNQCSPYFYREFDGSCSECPNTSKNGVITYTDSSFTIVTIFFSWACLYFIVISVQKIALAGQEQNKLSSGFYLFKNIVNYVIFFVLLSQLFGNTWMDDSHKLNSVLRGYTNFLRGLYRLPLNAVDYQCYQDQTLNPQFVLGAAPEQILYLNETTSGPLMSESSSRRITSTTLLSTLLSIFLLIKIFFCKVPEQEHKKLPTAVPSISVNSIANADPGIYSATPLSNGDNNDSPHASFALQSPHSQILSQRAYGTTQQILPPENIRRFGESVQPRTINAEDYEGGDSDSMGYEERKSGISEIQDSGAILNALDVSTPRNGMTKEDFIKAQRENTPYFNKTTSKGRPETQLPLDQEDADIYSYHSNRVISEQDKKKSYKSKQDTLESYAEVKSNLSINHMKRMQRYQFSPSALNLIIFTFISLIQIAEQMLLSISCEPIQVVNQAALANPKWAGPLQMWSFNFFDSSIQCDNKSGSFGSYEIYFVLLFLLCWLLVVPQFVLFRAGREYIIDYIGMTTKFALLVVIKYVLQFSEFYAMVVGSFIIVLQFIIFLIFRQGQVVSESQKLLKLNELNWIDFWMYITLILTAFFGLCLSLLKQDLNKNMLQFLFIMIFAINLLYLLFWVFKVLKFVLKHMSMSERFVNIHAYLTCACLKSVPDQTNENKLQQIQEAVEDEKDKEMELQKIDMLIQHLNDVQRNIIKNEMTAGRRPSDLLSNKSKYTNDLQLMQDIREIIGSQEDDDDARSYMDSVVLGTNFRSHINYQNSIDSSAMNSQVNNILNSRRNRSHIPKPKSRFLKPRLDDPETIQEELEIQMAEYEEHMRNIRSSHSSKPPIYTPNNVMSTLNTEQQKIKFVHDSSLSQVPSKNNLISLPSQSPMGTIPQKPEKVSISVTSENMALAFIKTKSGYEQECMNIKDQEDEIVNIVNAEEEGPGDTQYFNDTFSKTGIVMNIEPQFANNEIGNIMKALSSIRYDNALMKDKDVLSSQEFDSSNISPERNIKNKLEETNQSLHKLLQEVKQTNPKVHDEMSSMLPLQTAGSEIDNVMKMLSDLQEGMKSRVYNFYDDEQQDAEGALSQNMRESRSVFNKNTQQSRMTHQSEQNESMNQNIYSQKTILLPNNKSDAQIGKKEQSSSNQLPSNVSHQQLWNMQQDNIISQSKSSLNKKSDKHQKNYSQSSTKQLLMGQTQSNSTNTFKANNILKNVEDMIANEDESMDFYNNPQSRLSNQIKNTHEDKMGAERAIFGMSPDYAAQSYQNKPNNLKVDEEQPKQMRESTKMTIAQIMAEGHVDEKSDPKAALKAKRKQIKELQKLRKHLKESAISKSKTSLTKDNSKTKVSQDENNN